MHNLIHLLKSRTVWTTVANLILNAIQVVHPMVGPDTQLALNAIAAGLAIYFRLNIKALAP